MFHKHMSSFTLITCKLCRVDTEETATSEISHESESRVPQTGTPTILEEEEDENNANKQPKLSQDDSRTVGENGNKQPKLSQDDSHTSGETSGSQTVDNAPSDTQVKFQNSKVRCFIHSIAKS